MLRSAGLPAVGRPRLRAKTEARRPFTVAPSSRADSPTSGGWPRWLSPVHRAEGQRSGALSIEVH